MQKPINFIAYSHPKSIFSPLLLLFLFTLCAPCTNIIAQSSPCGLDLTEGYMHGLLDELPDIAQWEAQRGEVTLQDVPVRITMFNGNGGFNYPVDISYLNSAFGPAGLNFINCTPVNVIEDERIRYAQGSPSADFINGFLALFSYTSGSMEIYMNNLPGDPTALPPLTAYHINNPNYSVNPSEYRNWVNLKSQSDKDMIHETGHHFGLLHTFNPNKTYDVPAVDEDTPDYPEPVYIPNSNPQQMQPWWWGRELVMRQDNDQKTFKLANHGFAGDLLEDTPADCDAGNTPSYFPGCPLTAQNPLTCEFNSTLTYTDYNGDAIYPPPSGYSLGKNYMSYWGECRSEFTTGQNGRIAYYYETARLPEYALDKCGNFTDRVEFEGTSLGLHNVTARIRHTSTAQKCNVTTSEDGDFGGLLHADVLKAYVYHNGQKNTMAYTNDLLRIHYDHTNCEWLRGVKTSDLLAIQKHILNITPFTTGYQKIAADANKSNSVTTFDIVELRKLILGISSTLPNQDQPWRYVPEIITQNYTTDFNYNPFNVTAGGGNAYLEQGWEFTLTSQNNGKKGFDGIKIGDVDASWPTESDCPNETVVVSDEGTKPTLTVPSTSLTQNQTVALTFTVNAFQNVEAFQLGIRLPYDYFELLDVTNTTLSSFTEADNFGLTKLQENAVRTLWFNENGSTTSLQNNSTLFTLEVRAKQAISNLQSALKLDNSILPNEFWRTGTYTEPVSLTVSVQTIERSDDNVAKNLLQEKKEPLHCYPNPFTNNILLSYAHDGQSTQGELRITDVSGVEIYRQVLSIESGENIVTINALKDASKGMYTVSLKLNGNTHAANLVKE